MLLSLVSCSQVGCLGCLSLHVCVQGRERVQGCKGNVQREVDYRSAVTSKALQISYWTILNVAA